MLALSVKQPYAERLASGKKEIEYRTWKTKYTGPLLIVSSKKPSDEAAPQKSDDPAGLLVFGMSICIVELVKVTGDYGEYEWHVREPKRVKPVSLRGYAALYNVADALIQLA